MPFNDGYLLRWHDCCHSTGTQHATRLCRTRHHSCCMGGVVYGVVLRRGVHQCCGSCCAASMAVVLAGGSGVPTHIHEKHCKQGMGVVSACVFVSMLLLSHPAHACYPLPPSNPHPLTFWEIAWGSLSPSHPIEATASTASPLRLAEAADK
jgi:hypothetical protein